MTLDIRRLTADYAVGPQIDLVDLAAIKAAGFTTVINNRPDGEIGAGLRDAAMAQAAAKLGLTYLANPVVPGDFSPELVARQQEAIDAATGPVFAYCASGNRSTVVWELANAGRLPTDEMLAIAAQNGYSHDQFRPLIEAFARLR
jgi:uncharacterized protein (TIGR01244 family)